MCFPMSGAGPLMGRPMRPNHVLNKSRFMGGSMVRQTTCCRDRLAYIVCQVLAMFAVSAERVFFFFVYHARQDAHGRDLHTGSRSGHESSCQQNPPFFFFFFCLGLGVWMRASLTFTENTGHN
jgi:hypothetical protein